MENKDIIIASILIIGFIAFLSTSDITGHVTSTCSDSDYGKDSSKYGVCKSGNIISKDSCVDYDILSERFCTGDGECSTTPVQCLTGCIEGICIKKINVGNYVVHEKDIYSLVDQTIKIREIKKDALVNLDVDGILGIVEKDKKTIINGVSFENFGFDEYKEGINLRILFPSYYYLRLKEAISIDGDNLKVKEIVPYRYVVVTVNDIDYEIRLKKTIEVGNLRITNVDIIDSSYVILNTNKFYKEWKNISSYLSC